MQTKTQANRKETQQQKPSQQNRFMNKTIGTTEQ